MKSKNAQFPVNGQPVYIRGVNRQKHHLQTAHVLSEAGMRKDIELMKQLNINAVRMSHYPNHPPFYELCEEYGLYVCDEANIESHGRDTVRSVRISQPAWPILPVTFDLQRGQQPVLTENRRQYTLYII